MLVPCHLSALQKLFADLTQLTLSALGSQRLNSREVITHYPVILAGYRGSSEAGHIPDHLCLWTGCGVSTTLESLKSPVFEAHLKTSYIMASYTWEGGMML